MKSRILSGVFVAALLGTTGVIGAATAAPASTPPVTVSVGSPIQVSNKLLVTVPVKVVCDSLVGDTVLNDRVFVQIQQANGKSVSQGQGSIDGGAQSPVSPTPFLTCDGTTVNNLTVNIVGSGPFHGGGAIVTAAATHTVGTCTFFCTMTGTESGVAGPMAVNLRG